MATYLGVPIISGIELIWGICWVPPILGNHHAGPASAALAEAVAPPDALQAPTSAAQSVPAGPLPCQAQGEITVFRELAASEGP